MTAPGTTPDGERPNPSGYTLEIVLSSDGDVPIKPSAFQSKFREDVQLRGGSLSRTYNIEPGFKRTIWDAVPEHADELQIPSDTPSGDYFVCAVVDPWDDVEEEDEDNNVDCAPLSVHGGDSESSTGGTSKPSTDPTSGSTSDSEAEETSVPVTVPVSFPELSEPVARLSVREDAPDLDVDLSGMLGEDFAPIGWAKVTINDNPGLVAVSVARGEAILRFEEDRHGAANIIIEGVDEEGFNFALALFIDVEPTNDPPEVAFPMGEIRLQTGSGNIAINLTDVFSDVDLESHHDRLTFRVTNSNTTLLSFSLQDSDLVLHLQPAQHGLAALTVTATDQSGFSATDVLRLVVEPGDQRPTSDEPPEENGVQMDDGEDTMPAESHGLESSTLIADTSSSDTAEQGTPEPDTPAPDTPASDIEAEPSVGSQGNSDNSDGSDNSGEAAASKTGQGPDTDTLSSQVPEAGLVVQVADGAERALLTFDADGDVPEQASETPPAEVSGSGTPAPESTASPSIPLPLGPASAAPIPAPEVVAVGQPVFDTHPPPDAPNPSFSPLPRLTSQTTPTSPPAAVVRLAPSNGDEPVSGPVLVAVIALLGLAIAGGFGLMVRIRHRAPE